MKTQVQRWGNSLAVRIPKIYATQMGFTENTTVELDLVDGALILRTNNNLSLKQLLNGITDENLHSEADSGPSTGMEAW